MRDYLGVSRSYDDHSFKRRFRMPRALFEKVHHDLEGTSIFVRKVDALGKPRIHLLQRIVADVRMIGYGAAADTLDGYLQMG